MVMVTGGTGFIGSHLVEALCAQGEGVRCLVRRASFRKHPSSPPAGAELAYGDLLSGEGLDEALAGADTVIHLAGVTKALTAADYYAGNSRATEKLATAIARHGVRLVHVSSLAAIGPSRDGVPVEEDAEPHPLTPYGKSKLEAERIVRELVPNAVIARPPVVYGPRDTGVFQVLQSISRGLVCKDSGRREVFQRDLRQGLGGRPARGGPRSLRPGPSLLSGACEDRFLERSGRCGGERNAASPTHPDGSRPGGVRCRLLC